MLEYNRYNIVESTGSACQVCHQNPSRTMLLIGKLVDKAKQLVKVSLGGITTTAEIEQLIIITMQNVANHRKIN